MAKVTYRNVSYDTAALKEARNLGKVILTYRGITYVKEISWWTTYLSFAPQFWRSEQSPKQDFFTLNLLVKHDDWTIGDNNLCYRTITYYVFVSVRLVQQLKINKRVNALFFYEDLISQSERQTIPTMVSRPYPGEFPRPRTRRCSFYINGCRWWGLAVISSSPP